MKSLDGFTWNYAIGKYYRDFEDSQILNYRTAGIFTRPLTYSTLQVKQYSRHYIFELFLNSSLHSMIFFMYRFHYRNAVHVLLKCNTFTTHIYIPLSRSLFVTYCLYLQHYLLSFLTYLHY